jgi:hypothetical protein
MNDPIKIIWKFNNENRRVQYLQYIFIGDVPNNIMKILNIIENLSLYDSLIKITNDEYKNIEKFYGEFWYNKLFNTTHINASIFTIRESPTQKRELEEKYNKIWVDKHIMGHQLMEKKLIYSYESLIHNQLEMKSKKKSKESGLIQLVEDDQSFKTNIKTNFTIISKTKSKQSGGQKKLSKRSKRSKRSKISRNDDEEFIDEEFIDKKSIDENDDENDQDIDDDENELDDNPLIQSELEEDEIIDLDEIEKLYLDNDVKYDDNISVTSELIKKALNDNVIFDKKINQMSQFDETKDSNIYDENLRDVYIKKYVKINYIFKDDTIKTVKDKICCSLKLHTKFGSESYLLPSRQYIWSEYYFDNSIEKIMLGQKWLRRNEILPIDIEPNSNFRTYEELTGSLKTLRDSMKRYMSKIRREDDDNNILYDYNDYISSNEIYLIDIYNELGLNYKPNIETTTNILDIYLRLYFPKIRSDEFKNIIDYLSTQSVQKDLQKVEQNRIINSFETINNDLIVQTEIMAVVEDVKIDSSYKKLFKPTHIIHSIIHLKLRLKEGSKVDLYRIFNEFVITKEFPFILYHTIDQNIVYKFNETEIKTYIASETNLNVITKWFENTPYGISFKFPISDKFGERFIGITINESGRLEYKIVWKEDDMATTQDIAITYPYVIKLLLKINTEKNRQRFYIPEDSEFKYAFINTVQQFELPEKFVINHNDLSDFARFFYPYIVLVTDPRKRQTKHVSTSNVSKFGTYLRYKRVSRYENQNRIEMRILHFLRNYDISEKNLILEISKQFNITEDDSATEIESVMKRYPYIKKNRKVLKTIESIPKYKSPGIGIDIQGKLREKYKIRISGARDALQLEHIVRFINILIYLYIETYLYKLPERQKLKNKLKELTKIAKRRGKVLEILSSEEDELKVKIMGKVDKQRIGYKPEEGQTQWTRCCQNSGETKRRQPSQFNSANIGELIKKGYKLNKKLNIYEKKVLIKNSKSKTKEEVILNALKVPELDADGEITQNELYYTCDPDDNGEHFYVGFLTRCKNPHGYCMPCCFKKDPILSKNKSKQNFYAQCYGTEKDQDNEKSEADVEAALNERLYILQDTNKIQEGRFGLLPSYLDFYFNIYNDHDKYIKQHYLSKTKNGYFFKYGSIQASQPFLNAIGSCLDLSLDMVLSKIISTLEADKSDQIYTSLNKGDVKTQFGERKNFIEYIKTNNLDFSMINNLLIIPKVLTKNGLNIIIFKRKFIKINKTFEKEKIIDDFILECSNIEDSTLLTNPLRETIFILKDSNNYYPIVLVSKDDPDDKNIVLTKTFLYKNEPKNIVNNVNIFYQKNCNGSFMDTIVYKDSSLTATQTYSILQSNKIKVRYQMVDSRNKTTYFITENSTIVPTRPSGSLYEISFVKSLDKYLKSLSETIKNLNEIAELTKLKIKPKIVYFDEELDSKIKSLGIITELGDQIPVLEEFIEISLIKKLGLSYQKTPIVEKIDKKIIKHEFTLDDRIQKVNLDAYLSESYDLFRLELSTFINKFENMSLREKIIKIVNSTKLDYDSKVDNIRLILYKLVDAKLYAKYKEIIRKKGSVEDAEANIEVNDDAASEVVADAASEVVADAVADVAIQEGGRYDKLLHQSLKLPNLNKYKINNDRNSCTLSKSKDVCNEDIHCKWTNSGCYMSARLNEILQYITLISEEIGLNDVKSFEILKIDGYFVSDIVDLNKFTERSGQTILRNSGSNVKKILSNIFEIHNIPIIGKKKLTKIIETNYEQIQADFQLIDLKSYSVQKIIHNNMSFIRAYVNGFYFIQNIDNDIQIKNLGYYSILQTELTNYFRGKIIDYLMEKSNKDAILTTLFQHMNIKKEESYVQKYIIKNVNSSQTRTNGFVDYFILSTINLIPIILYDDSNKIMMGFDNGSVLDLDNIDNLSKYNQNPTCINIRLSYFTNGQTIHNLKSIPDQIEVLYFN